MSSELTGVAWEPDPYAVVRERLTGSAEQEAIWEFAVRCPDRPFLISAVAGSGKTTTLFEGAWRVLEAGSGSGSGSGSKTRYLAFNKLNQLEAEKRGAGRIEAKTFHAAGLEGLRRAGVVFGTVLRGSRGRVVVDGLRNWTRAEWEWRKLVVELFDAARNSGALGVREVEALIEHHALDFGSAEREQVSVELVVRGLEVAAEPESYREGIDFTDMLWLAWGLDVPVPGFDELLVDECQDLNKLQHWYVAKMARAGARVVMAGDPRQAIYGWRGAAVGGFGLLARAVGAVVGFEPVSFPLTVTRRCPVSHVRLAQVIVPEIRARDGAPEGRVRRVSYQEFIDRAGPEDMVLCRTNAPLVEAVVEFGRVGREARLLGAAELESGLVALVREAEGRTVAGTLGLARKLTERRVAGALARNRPAVAGRYAETLEQLEALAVGVVSVPELKRAIDSLVSVDEQEETDVVKLGTVHKQKGLEAPRVWVLREDLMPGPWASEGWQLEQEWNLRYVALTRGVGDAELCFVGRES